MIEGRVVRLTREPRAALVSPLGRRTLRVGGRAEVPARRPACASDRHGARRRGRPPRHAAQPAARTIAQDEATSIVYGMPREAAILGAAERILPLGEIAGALGAIGRARLETSQT